MILAFIDAVAWQIFTRNLPGILITGLEFRNDRACPLGACDEMAKIFAIAIGY